MCEYPLIFDGNPNKTMYETNDNQDLNVSGTDLLPRIGSSATNVRNDRAFSTSSNLGLANKVAKPIIKQAEALDENRIVLYKKGK